MKYRYLKMNFTPLMMTTPTTYLCNLWKASLKKRATRQSAPVSDHIKNSQLGATETNPGKELKLKDGIIRIKIVT